MDVSCGSAHPRRGDANREKSLNDGRSFLPIPDRLDSFQSLRGTCSPDPLVSRVTSGKALALSGGFHPLGGASRPVRPLGTRGASCSSRRVATGAILLVWSLSADLLRD